MRIRNNRTFDIFLAYAGQDHKGWSVRAGKCGPQVPAKRFYDPELQADWKAGNIDLVLTEADKAILGNDVSELTQTKVTITEDEVVAKPKPSIPRPPARTPGGPPPEMRTPGAPTAGPSPLYTGQKKTASIQPEKQSSLANSPVVAPAPKKTVEKLPPPAAPPVVPPPDGYEEVPTGNEIPVPTTFGPMPTDAPPVIDAGVATQAEAAATQPLDGELHCVECGKTDKVKMDDRVRAPLCRIHRGAVTTRLKHGKPPLKSTPPAQGAPAQPVVAAAAPPAAPTGDGPPTSIGDLQHSNRSMLDPTQPETEPQKLAKIEGFIGGLV